MKTLLQLRTQLLWPTFSETSNPLLEPELQVQDRDVEN